MKILIIEDDLTIAGELKSQLESWDYEIGLVDDFSRLMEEVKDFDPHLILLDINLPSKNGYYWCREIRKDYKVPIIFISSRSEGMDQVMAMEMGGDDFVQKSFDMDVLTAKIHALLRRAYDFSAPLEVFDRKGLSLSLSEARLSYRGRSVGLTGTELEIMTILFKNFNSFVAREDIMDFCWQDSHFIDDNTLAVNISRLRKKTKGLGLEGLIETKVNVGYRLRGDVL